MKTINTILAAAVISLLTLASCESFLTLEPETSLSTAIAFDNVEGIEAGINGCYSILQSDWAERQFIFAECMASNVEIINPINNSNFADVLNHATYTDLLDPGTYLWRMNYQVISLVNNMLLAIPQIEVTDGLIEEQLRQQEGELLCLRGLCYFVLNRYWAQPQNGLSVPVLTAPITIEDQPVRASIEAVKSQVLADLNAAEGKIGDLSSNDGRVTIYALQALLARVHFEYKNYAEAKNYANTVIESGQFNLLSGDLQSAYGAAASGEHIFYFSATANDRAAENLWRRYSNEGNPNPMLGLTDDMYTRLSVDTNNLRYQQLSQDFTPFNLTRKYDDRTMYIPYISLPEMYLVRAETRAMEGDLSGGLADLNAIRSRVGLADESAADQQELLDKILDERQLELALQGDDFHNLRRLERPIGGFPWDEAEYKLVFFIPTSEINLNPNMIQNDIW